jgi:uncharacterized membrane protein (UPF0127 family)
MSTRLTLLALAASLAMSSCHRSDDTATVAASDSRPTPTPHRPSKAPEVLASAVILTPPDGATARVAVEVVRSRPKIRRGLMYRQHLPANQGMLFLMRREMVHTFWMKNTLIPLDMLFISSDMVVAGVVENTEPRTTGQRFVDKPSRYVLEVNGGWAAAHNVAAGAKVEFENVEL